MRYHLYVVLRLSLARDEIKVAYMANFIEFTAWPDHALSKEKHILNICFIGRKLSSQTITSLDKRVIQDHQIRVLRLSPGAPLSACHAVFFGITDTGALQDGLKNITHTPVLTVSDMPDFIKYGGMIELFTTPDAKIRFRINQQAVMQAELALSSKLLRLADTVYKQQP